jgi:primosomal replication protein N
VAHNRLVITGSLVELKTLRHTPAGIPVTEIRLKHGSRQIEALVEREVECELAAVAIGDLAKLIQGAKLGDMLQATGFLANRGKSARQLVLHLTNIEFLEGN